MEQRRAVYLLPAELVEAVEKAAATETERLGRKVWPATVVREILRESLSGPKRPATGRKLIAATSRAG